MASHEENPYQSPEVLIPAPRQSRPRVGIVQVLMALSAAALAGLMVWVGLLIAFFASSKEYWPGWACAAPALLVAALVLHGATLGPLGRAIAALGARPAVYRWAARFSILCAMLTLGLRMLYLLVIPFAGVSPEVAMQKHYVIALFFVVPGFLFAGAALDGGIRYRDAATFRTALLGAVASGGYLSLCLVRILMPGG